MGVLRKLLALTGSGMPGVLNSEVQDKNDKFKMVFRPNKVFIRVKKTTSTCPMNPEQPPEVREHLSYNLLIAVSPKLLPNSDPKAIYTCT